MNASRIFGLLAISGLATFATTWACSSASPAIVADPLPDASQTTPDVDAKTPEIDGGTSLASAGTGAAFCAKTLGAMISATDACCSAIDKSSSYYKQLFDAYRGAQQACSTGLEAGIGKARVTYDQAAAQACFASFDAALGTSVCGKDLFFALDLLSTPACRKVFGGTVAAGGTCGADFECQADLTCLGDGKSPDGTCVATPAVGAKCGIPKGAANLQFGAHRTCALGSDCRAGVCVAARAGFECDLDRDCDADKKCVLGKCATARGQGGATCEIRDDCDLGFYCDRDVDAGSGTCAPRGAAPTTCNPNFPGGPQCHGRCIRGDAGAASCVTFCGAG